MMYHKSMKRLTIDLGDYSSQKNKSSQLVAAINAVGAQNMNHTAGIIRPDHYTGKKCKKHFHVDLEVD